jgi:hypothetical protein
MNAMTTLDRQCHELAAQAIVDVENFRMWMHAADEQREGGWDDDYELCEAAEYEHAIRQTADRIIALRTAALDERLSCGCVMHDGVIVSTCGGMVSPAVHNAAIAARTAAAEKASFGSDGCPGCGGSDVDLGDARADRIRAEDYRNAQYGIPKL